MAKNDLGPYLKTCIDCFEVLPLEEFKISPLRCTKCARAMKEARAEMSEKKAIATACRTVTKALASAQRDKEPAALPAIINSFLHGVGGAEKVGTLLKEDFNRLRGVGLSEEELMKHEVKEGTLQRYWQMLLRGMVARDEQVSQVDLQGFTDEELQATLIPLAADLLLNDADFRTTVLREAVNRDPNLMDEILKERTQIVNMTVIKPKDEAITFTPESMDVDPAELASDEAD